MQLLRAHKVSITCPDTARHADLLLRLYVACVCRAPPYSFAAVACAQAQLNHIVHQRLRYILQLAALTCAQLQPSAWPAKKEENKGKETVSRSFIIINKQDVESCSQRHAARGLQRACEARLRQGGVRYQARQPAGRHAALLPPVRRAILHHRGQHMRLHDKTVMCVPLFQRMA